MAAPDAEIIKEVEEQRPRWPVGLLSKQEKDTLVERALVGLYRWYLARSQATRNWNPDRSFDWRALRTDHSAELNGLIEGFFAVEQYVPDYTSTQVMLTRKSHGRASFHIRWGAEEQKHADLWLNALLFLRRRSRRWIEEYKHALRQVEYRLPWDDPLHMLFYAVLQERATQLSYLSTAVIARGGSDRPELRRDADPVLEQAATTIAGDEAAHYSFFLEIARVYLYYYPAQALEAFRDVIKSFAMPSLSIIPNGGEFYELVHRTGVYGLRAYAHDVVQVLFDQLGVKGRRAVEDGIRRSRQVPDENGELRDTAVFGALDYTAVEASVRRLFARIRRYEDEIGLAEVDPTTFVASGYTAT
ncbi:MAG TPA: acyl-ACP desaturase [Methylomirabilota bacterium]|nr:acyl-ACP desaturase [Methylomirabilota bacterium]